LHADSLKLASEFNSDIANSTISNFNNFKTWGFFLRIFRDRTLLHITAVLFFQLRLLSNLSNGMAAIEGGKVTNSGELYDDFLDRIADPLLLVGLGYEIISQERLWNYLSWPKTP
jgi:phosphatidylglycerophosphate synthase